ncbi:hypothetical protein P3T76_005395 [Phytophthora citrophthora]|uniref:Uncharacterized protein n=1 Tax=Phytophthora citrophthora TaxID=4793 RepID=A0AAD9GSX1_9STRA|nr:hypothetical protein P3T76_005395 [Phytophthora citrophthora]
MVILTSSAELETVGMRTTRKRTDRGVQFIRSNLELLGFGTRRDALVQTVKELFENGDDG